MKCINQSQQMIYFDDINILNIGHKARQIKKNGWKYK
jgi:hypothetical protein